MKLPRLNPQVTPATAKVRPSSVGRILAAGLLLFVLVGATLRSGAQLAVPPPMPITAYQPLAAEQLDQLLGPIALYPDALIAQILPASTLPTEIVMADRFISGGGDANAVDEQPWDASIQALARYPSLLQWMDQNLDWTTELGQAFLNQQQDVMDTIQRLRQSAYNMGNLQSTPEQEVDYNDGEIDILPAQPGVIFVPTYEWDTIYGQAGFALSFGIGYPIGDWLNCDFDWHTRHLVTWNRSHPRPANWWHERAGQRHADLGRISTVWQSREHPDYPHAETPNRGDRGWNVPPSGHPATPAPRRTPAAPSRPASGPGINADRHPTPPREPAIPAVQHSPAPAQHYDVRQPTASGALIGVQSSQQTKAYSDRGRESVQAATRPAAHEAASPRPEPASHPAAPSGNGGGHGSGSTPRR